MQMPREDLLAVLETVEPALTRSDTIEEMAHVWFDGERLTASNDEGLGIQVPYKSELKGGVRGALLIGLLHNSRAKDVEITPSGKSSIQLKAAKTRVELSLLPIDKCLAETPDISKLKRFTISDKFKAALKNVLISAGNSKSTDIEERGVIVYTEKDTLRLITTDSGTLAISSVVTPPNWPFKKGDRTIIPTAFVKQLLGLTGDVAVAVGKDSITARTDKIAVFSPLLDATEARDLAESADEVTKGAVYTPIPARLKLALARAAVLLKGQKVAGIEFNAKEEVLRISATTMLGELKDSMALEKPLPTIKSKLDPELVQRGLERCKMMALQERGMVLTDEENSFTYIIASY